MANRVTVADVKLIKDIATTVLDLQVEVFITSANILTNNVNTVGGLTDADLLKEIERWLAAHFVSILDPQAKTEKAEEVSETIQEKVDLHFNQTRWGQQALVLDTTGYLDGLQAKALNGGGTVATVAVLGSI